MTPVAFAALLLALDQLSPEEKAALAAELKRRREAEQKAVLPAPEGEPLWPARYDLKRLAAKRREIVTDWGETMKRTLMPQKPPPVLQEGQDVVLCEHVALQGAKPVACHQDPPTRILRAGGAGLRVSVALLCPLCQVVPPQAGGDMFLAIIKDGKPVPQR